MIKSGFKNVQEVSSFRLCIGCGACASVCPEENISLINILDDGIRPFLRDAECTQCFTCLKVCPGIDTSYDTTYSSSNANLINNSKYWGPILEIWEGFATDKLIRQSGSSGGLCTALSIFCLEKSLAGGTVHIGNDPEIAYLNSTYRSTSRHDIVSRTGSRYAPASPCDSFNLIESASDKSVFIGKPCDIAALRKAQAFRPSLSDKCILSIGFFCAGAPSTNGTLELLEKLNVHLDEVKSIRYRGHGWPGMFTVDYKESPKKPTKLSYEESWGFVQKFRPFRCYLCPDLTAEFADISVGDPWYRERDTKEPGRSIIIIRNEIGKSIFRQALEEGYVKAEKVDPKIILLSQSNLLGKRKAIWGRIIAMRILNIPTPRLIGFYLFKNWLELSFSNKLRSFFGTIRRIIQRKYFKPRSFTD